MKPDHDRITRREAWNLLTALLLPWTVGLAVVAVSAWWWP